MTTFLLVRHGESDANCEGFFAGQLDVNLREKGILQAEKTAQFIADEYNVDVVYASDLKRAYRTGEIIAKMTGADIVADKGLREINAGQWQGRKFDDLVSSFGDTYSVWLNDIGVCRCDGGESVKELGERVFKAVTDIAEQNPDKTVVIATHATPIRAIECIAGGHPIEFMKNIPWVDYVKFVCEKAKMLNISDSFGLPQKKVVNMLSEANTDYSFTFIPKRKLSENKLRESFEKSISAGFPIIVRVGENLRRLPYKMNGSERKMRWHYFTVIGIENDKLTFCSWGKKGEMLCSDLYRYFGFTGGIIITKN